MSSQCVVLGITGGIAAYKSAEIVSRLRKQDIEVRVIMTSNATRFITPLTLETLSANPVVDDLFNRETPWEVEHISLAKRADVFVIAPATANVIREMGPASRRHAYGHCACDRAPILVAPP